MTFLCDNPWIFHRDEIDLLEEEMDDIYRSHRVGAQDAVSQMEDRIFKEQMQTEERSEAELSLEIGVEDLRMNDRDSDGHTHEVSDGPLADALRAQSARDPLYERIYVWTQRVFALTTQRYVVEQIKDEDVFRVRVNVNMIPIKFASALLEKMMGDTVSDRISEKEQQLCFTYFVRTLDSLRHRAFLGDEEAMLLETEGRELERSARLHLV